MSLYFDQTVSTVALCRARKSLNRLRKFVGSTAQPGSVRQPAIFGKAKRDQAKATFQGRALLVGQPPTRDAAGDQTEIKCLTK
jgi:hypothetical protein